MPLNRNAPSREVIDRRARSAHFQEINAKIEGRLIPSERSPVGFGAVGTVTTGLLKGSKEAVYTAAVPTAGIPSEPPTTLSYLATQFFHTDHGDLDMSVVGISDNARLVFTEIARITGGTGRFAGATGELFISGTLGADGFTFEGQITGRIGINRDGP